MRLGGNLGQLVLGGFSGSTLPDVYAQELRRGGRAGAILFARNLEGGVHQVAALCRQIHAAAPAPLLAIDQEGGRVARLRTPFLELPDMTSIAAIDDEALAERLAGAVGAELAAVGFTINFAPVLDVMTNPDNPVIGDRAFGSDAATCARFGVAWIRGLQAAGVLATAKHFPGHGDTSRDSHFELPVVTHGRERLETVELAPFRAAADAGVAAMMTAHVLYTALDPQRPATLSPQLAALRKQVGFDGLLVSDDLEMRAIAARWPAAEAAVEAIAAGCDALLVCHSFEAQTAAVEALTHEVERSAAFRDRCAEALRRMAQARQRSSARPLDDGELRRAIGGTRSREVAAELARRVRS